MVVFLHGFFTIEYIDLYGVDNETVIGLGMKMSVQVIIAPMIAIHRMFLLLLGEYNMPRLRELGLKTRAVVKFYDFKEYVSNDFNRLTKIWKIIAIFLWIIAFIFICIFFYLIVII
jgi:hypothetical protein